MCSKGAFLSFYLGQLFLSDTLQQNVNKWKTIGHYLTYFTVCLTSYNVWSTVSLHDVVFFADLGV
jgi:hypothetical protein